MNNQLVPDVGQPTRLRSTACWPPTVEVPVDRLPDFLDWFDEHVGMRRATFDSLYNGAGLNAVKRRYDQDNRLATLYDKAVRHQ